jgi:hypothetical protein
VIDPPPKSLTASDTFHSINITPRSRCSVSRKAETEALGVPCCAISELAVGAERRGELGVQGASR